MKNNIEPKFLYHYTTIRGLTHILESGKIRFSPLTGMDDKLEGSSSELQHVKKYVFVSSWTDKEDESIPIWSMYADQMKGVRIKLPLNMFIEHTFELSNEKIKGINDNISASSVSSIINEEQTFGSNYVVLPFRQYLWKVVYKPFEEIANHVFHENLPNHQRIIKFYDYGYLKTEDWSFQNEWRFIKIAVPVNYSEEYAFENIMPRIHEGHDINLDYLYAEIKPDALNNMEILLGPKMDKADEILVNLLMEKYNPNAKNNIKKSKLHIG